jgi:hypothetical protein
VQRLKERIAFPFLIGSLAALAIAGAAFAIHETPQSASPIDASLVPAFQPCASPGNPPNGRHAPPLSAPSCDPPKPTSSVAAVGPQATGAAQVRAFSCPLCASPIAADVFFTVKATDVRAGSPVGPDYDPNPGGPDMSLIARWRITDHYNATDGASCAATYSCPGTVAELDFPVPVDCVPTADSSVGSNCGADTSANAILPGSIQENKKAVVQVFRLRLNDAGVDGKPATADDTLFEQQGIYVQ